MNNRTNCHDVDSCQTMGKHLERFVAIKDHIEQLGEMQNRVTQFVAHCKNLRRFATISNDEKLSTTTQNNFRRSYGQ